MANRYCGTIPARILIVLRSAAILLSLGLIVLVSARWH